jgi:GNAT superfamily N-acetyltransferase
MDIISVREEIEYVEAAITYFQSKWASAESMMVYRDCISHCIDTDSPLPQWYLLKNEDEIIGCAGLITNDFISRMDLYPWLCALYIEEKHRGNAYGEVLLHKAMDDTKKGGFSTMYLCTDHIGYYEKYGFKYIGMGFHPWGDDSRIYKIEV